MSNVPKISVLLPVYNSWPYLQKAVASIQNQTFAEFECLLLDATNYNKASQADEKVFLENIVQNDPRFILCRQPDMPLAESLAYGVIQARAPIIARMDADDIALPKRFEIQYNAINSNQDLALLGVSYQYIDQNDKLGRKKVLPLKPELPDALLWGCPFLHPGVMLRKSAVMAAGNYRKAFKRAEDYDLWLRLQNFGSLENLSDILMLYRIHGLNSTISQSMLNRSYAIRAQILYFLEAMDISTEQLLTVPLNTLLSYLSPQIMSEILMRMAACSAIHIGDEMEDPEITSWFKQMTYSAEATKARTYWHLACAKRYLKTNKTRAVRHILKGVNVSPKNAAQIIWNYIFKA